jgi:hypothetical protein
MFKISGPLPSKEDMQAHQIAQIVSSVEFPPYPKDSADIWTPEQWAELKQKWLAFRGPVRDPKNFIVLHPYNKVDSEDNELFSAIIFYDGLLDVDIFDQYDVCDESKQITTVDPVSQLIGAKKLGPNSPCHCNSGKKLKKCCRI